MASPMALVAASPNKPPKVPEEPQSDQKASLKDKLAIACMKCQEPTTIADSAPAGRNPNLRIDKACGSNKRNMERRVKKKPAADPLVKWWKALQEDPDKECRWYRRMKREKQRNERMSDQEIMMVSEEVQGTGLEKRKRAEYYGFDSVVEDHPTWSEEQCLEHWAKLVAASTNKIVDDDGEVWIAKSRRLIVDDVDSNMNYKRVITKKAVETADDLTEAVSQAAGSQDRFRRMLQASRPTPYRLPPQAKQVDAIAGNVTDNIAVALGKTALQGTLRQEMIQVAIEQAARDEDMMQEVQEDLEKAKLAKDTKKATDPDRAKRHSWSCGDRHGRKPERNPTIVMAIASEPNPSFWFKPWA
jgi:hypothetical protein